MKPVDLLLAVAVVATWGANFPVVKVAVNEGFPPVFFVAVRYMIVALILIPFVAVPHRRWGRVLLLSFIMGTLHFPAMFIATKMVPGGTASVLAQLQAVFAVLLGAAAFREKLDLRVILGALLAFAGVAAISGGPTADTPLLGVALAIFGAFMFAVQMTLLKRFGDFGGHQLNAWMGLFIVPQTLLVSLLLEQGQIEAMTQMTWKGALALAYQVGPMVVFSHWLWYRLLRRHQMTRLAPLMLLMPGFGLFFGWLLLGEAVTVLKIAGAVLTVAGVALAAIRFRGPAPGN